MVPRHIKPWWRRAGSFLEDDHDPAYPIDGLAGRGTCFSRWQRAVTFTAPVAVERYRCLEATLRQFHYGTLKRDDKGQLQAFARKVTGYSCAAEVVDGAVAPKAAHRRPALVDACGHDPRHRHRRAAHGVIQASP